MNEVSGRWSGSHVDGSLITTSIYSTGDNTEKNCIICFLYFYNSTDLWSVILAAQNDDTDEAKLKQRELKLST